MGSSWSLKAELLLRVSLKIVNHFPLYLFDVSLMPVGITQCTFSIWNFFWGTTACRWTSPTLNVLATYSTHLFQEQTFIYPRSTSSSFYRLWLIMVLPHPPLHSRTHRIVFVAAVVILSFDPFIPFPSIPFHSVHSIPFSIPFHSFFPLSGVVHSIHSVFHSCLSIPCSFHPFHSIPPFSCSVSPFHSINPFHYLYSDPFICSSIHSLFISLPFPSIHSIHILPPFHSILPFISISIPPSSISFHPPFMFSPLSSHPLRFI